MFKPKLKIPRNFYMISSVAFLVWMTFFDSNDIYSQFQLSSKLSELEDEKAYYIDKIEEVKADREALLNNEDLLEQFAREKYYLKKDNEDVFVVVDVE
ncbi:MAG: septum formation initiator family protein [Reichenbachiella sp.]